MLFNEMNLKIYYEMRKEEMEKAILASKYTKDHKKNQFIKNYFQALKKNKTQKINLEAAANCCTIKVRQTCCCEN